MNPKSGQIIPNSSSGVVLDPDTMPKEAWAAIIRKLNQKSQRVTQVFKDSYEISTDDLRQVMDCVRQEFTHCTIIDESCNATIVLSNNQRFDFNSWADLENFDRSIPHRTRSVSFELIFDILPNAKSEPERYSIQISVQNEPAIFGISIGPLSLKPIDSFDAPPAPMVATVAFSNYILGKNLIGTIETWEKGLKRRTAPLRKRLQKYSSNIAAIVASISFLSGIFLSRVFAPIDTGATVSDLAQFIMLAGATTYLFAVTGKWIGRQIERNIDRQRHESNITLSEGDKRFNERTSEQNKGYIKRAIGYTILLTAEIAISYFAPKIIPLIPI